LPITPCKPGGIKIRKESGSHGEGSFLCFLHVWKNGSPAVPPMKRILDKSPPENFGDLRKHGRVQAKKGAFHFSSGKPPFYYL
jgi:hypothetical protein